MRKVIIMLIASLTGFIMAQQVTLKSGEILDFESLTKTAKYSSESKGKLTKPLELKLNLGTIMFGIGSEVIVNEMQKKLIGGELGNDLTLELNGTKQIIAKGQKVTLSSDGKSIVKVVPSKEILIKIEGGALFFKANEEIEIDQKQKCVKNGTLAKECKITIDGRAYPFAKDKKIMLSYDGKTVSNGILSKDTIFDYAGVKIPIKGGDLPAGVVPGYSVSFMMGKLNTVLTSKDFDAKIGQYIIPIKGLKALQLRKTTKEYIYSLYMYKEVTLKFQGQDKKYSGAMGMDFDENGSFIGTSKY